MYFYIEMRKIVDFCVEKENYAIKMTLHLTSHISSRDVACGHDSLSPFKMHDFRLSARLC